MVEIKHAMELGPHRQFGVEAGSLEEVQGDFSLGQKAIPEVEWELAVSAA